MLITSYFLSVSGPEEMRGMHHRILEIYVMLSFRRRVYSIFVSSPSFSFVKGSFTMYFSVVWRTWRDERLACLRCGDISHSLFWWAGTLGQSNFHHFSWSKAHLQSTIVSLKGLNRREVHVSMLQRYFTFYGFGGVISWSVLHLFSSLKARLQCTLVSFEGPKETRGVCLCVPEIFYIFSFGGQVP